MVEVFGIPIIAGSKFKNSGKLNHVASIMAELLDQDSDGCADDPNVLRNLLMKRKMKSPKGEIFKLRKAFVLPNKKPAKETAKFAMLKKGFKFSVDVDFPQIVPKCSGLHQTKDCMDASIEEIYHFITSLGHSIAYSKIFGNKWQAPSNLTRAMDIARYFFGFKFSY